MLVYGFALGAEGMFTLPDVLGLTASSVRLSQTTNILLQSIDYLYSPLPLLDH